METKVLQPAHKMTTAQCVIECSGYLRTIASKEFEGEDWQTAPKLRRQNLLTDFLCNLELSGEEFAELYASYHVANPKGSKTSAAHKEWFERMGLHRDKPATSGRGGKF